MTPKTSSIRVLGMVGAALLLTTGCSDKQGSDKAMTTSASTKAIPAAKVNPAAVQALAKAPAPPATATQQTSIGKGKAAIKTASSAGETDSSWVESIDIDGDGDGVVEQTTLLWDDEDKVLFAFADTDVPCEMGGTAVVSILIGVNGNGNPRGRPAGSGFYAVYFDATECGAMTAGLFGAKFDARGRVTAAGAVLVDEATDDVTVVAVR